MTKYVPVYKPTTDDIYLLEFLAKAYGCKVELKSKYMYGGGYYRNKKKIVINRESGESRTHLFSILCHELGHHFCWEHHKYMNYHYLSDTRLVRLLGLKAERFVDKIGEKIFNQYFPHLHYEKCYRNANGKKWYYTEFLDKSFPKPGSNAAILKELDELNETLE